MVFGMASLQVPLQLRTHIVIAPVAAHVINHTYSVVIPLAKSYRVGQSTRSAQCTETGSRDAFYAAFREGGPAFDRIKETAKARFVPEVILFLEEHQKLKADIVQYMG